MKKALTVIAAVAIVFGVCISAFAGNAWNDADTSPAIAVRYMDDAKVGTITVAAGVVTLVDDGNTNTHTFASDGVTMASLVASITSATNSAGSRNFQAVYWNSIAADTVTNGYLIARSATALNKEWDYGVKWDTSACLHYDAAIGVMVQTTPVNAGLINRIYGDPLGTTGSVINVYVDGEKAYQSTRTNAASFDQEVSIVVGTQPAFVRCTLDTTATTGGIGISDTSR
jgi:hypothetical protein